MAAGLSLRERAALTVIALFVLLPGTIGVSLTDRDEGWYAQVAREMLESGDWLIPTYLGEPWIAKPPLLYWCVASSFALLGTTALAARLVSVLAMAGSVHLVATLGAWTGGRRAGWIAAIVFVTAGLPAIVGKLVLTDALLVLCTLWAACSLWQIARRRTTAAAVAGLWVSLGLGALAKGPAVFLFVGAFALGLLVRGHDRRWSWSWRVWVGLPLALLVAVPWYACVAWRAGDILREQFVAYEVLSRLTAPPHGHVGPPGYYLLTALAGWLPWTALVPGAVVEAWRSRRRDPHARLLLIWFATPWLLLELVPGKLPHYILPCYVPLAIMLGRAWNAAIERAPTAGERNGLRVWAAIPTLLGAAIACGGIARWGDAWSVAATGTGVLLAAGFAVVLWQVWRTAPSETFRQAWAWAVGATVVFHVVLGTWLLPALEPYRLSRDIAERANALARRGDACLFAGYDEPTLFFYLDRPARRAWADELRTVVERPASAGVIIAREQELHAAGIDPNETPQVWQRVEGFNYVKGDRTTVWIARVHP